MKTLKNLLLTAGIFAGISAGEFENANGQEIKKVPCVSEEEVKLVASEIPKYLKNKGDDTYLIENVPESKNGYIFGGELSVYIQESLRLSIFDRTDTNPSNWYNVSNLESKNGCVDFSIYLTGKPSRHLSNVDAQTKFNAFIYKVKAMIQTQK